MKLTKTQLKKMIVEAIQEEMGSSEKNLSVLFQRLQAVVKDLDESVSGEEYAFACREMGEAWDLISQMIEMLQELAGTLHEIDPSDSRNSDEPMIRVMNMVGVSSIRNT